MRAVGICLLVAVAIIATVATFPGSSWVFKNQLDLLGNHASQGDASFGDPIGSLVPGWVTKAETYSGTSDAQELTHALFLGSPKRMEALEHFASTHPSDPVGWAAVIRMTCMAGVGYPDEKPEDYRQFLKSQSKNLEAAINACRNGERLEPNNAYFPMMRAVFSMEANRLGEMASALRTAGSKGSYNSHLRDQIQVMEQAAQSAKGYRGEMVRTALQASVMLPDFAHVKSLSRYLNRAGSLAEKRDLIQTLHEMGKGEDAGIGFVVALGSVRNLLNDPLPVRSTDQVKHPASFWLARASKFDEEVKTSKIGVVAPNTVEIYQGLAGLVDAFQKYVRSRQSIFDNAGAGATSMRLVAFGMIAPFVSLSGLLIAVLFGGAALALSRVKSDNFRAMVPHLICLPVVWIFLSVATPCCDPQSSSISPCCESGSFPVEAAIAVGQITLALLRLRSKPAKILTAVEVVVLGLIVLQSPLLLTASSFMALAGYFVLALLPWFLSDDQRRRFASIAGGVLALLAIATLDPGAIYSGIAYGLAVGMMWVNTEGKPSKAAAWLAGIAFVLVCAGAGMLITQRWVLAGEQSSALIGSLFLGLVGALGLTGKPFVVARNSICTAYLALSCIFLISVGLQVRNNSRESLAETRLLNEASNIRKSVAATSP